MTTSADLTDLLTPRPIAEWHEDLGPQLWWRFPLTEAPYVGSPLDAGQVVEVVVRYYKRGKVLEKVHRHMVGEWPGYHTHFTPIPHINAPPTAEAEEPDPISKKKVLAVSRTALQQMPKPPFIAPIEPTSSALSPRGRGTIRVAEVAANMLAERTAWEADHAAWAGLKLSQRQRCARAVMHLRMYNSLSRRDIMSMGEVSLAQASYDIREILKRCPNLMHYDVRKKHYVLTTRK